jgi:valyl-tRNA synthetase
VLERTLALLHPYMPYVTEEIWSYVPDAVRGDRAMLMTTPWPKPGPRDEAAEAQMQVVMDVIQAVRTARAEHKVEADRRIDAVLVAGEHAGLLREQSPAIATLARVGALKVESTLNERPGQALHLLAGTVEVYLPLAGLVDLAGEAARLEGELKAAREQRARTEALLGNESFVGRARPDVVERERAKLAEMVERIGKLEQQLGALA